MDQNNVCGYFADLTADVDLIQNCTGMLDRNVKVVKSWKYCNSFKGSANA